MKRSTSLNKHLRKEITVKSVLNKKIEKLFEKIEKIEDDIQKNSEEIAAIERKNIRFESFPRKKNKRKKF